MVTRAAREGGRGGKYHKCGSNACSSHHTYHAAYHMWHARITGITWYKTDHMREQQRNLSPFLALGDPPDPTGPHVTPFLGGPLPSWPPCPFFWGIWRAGKEVSVTVSALDGISGCLLLSSFFSFPYWPSLCSLHILEKVQIRSQLKKRRWRVGWSLTWG